MNASNRKGFRGYMGTRMGLERSTPQHIQQLVMRDYCQKHGMTYLLAAVEYRMPGCTMILDAVLSELHHIEGIVMYSLALFPQAREKRMEMYRKLLATSCSLHAAVENITISDWETAMHLEDNWLVQEVMQSQSPDIITYLKQWDNTHAAT